MSASKIVRFAGLDGVPELEKISGIDRATFYLWVKSLKRRWLFDAAVEKASREKAGEPFVTQVLLQSYLTTINELVKNNINTLSSSACVNRADFKCSSVQYYVDCWGDKGFKAVFDECAPAGDAVTTKWLSELLESNGIKNFSVELEW